MVIKKLLKEHSLEWPVRGSLETLQVNLGNICNMTCTHCHVNAGPSAKEVMSEEMGSEVIRFLFKHKIKTLDLTGGAPELAPPFRSIVTSASDLVEEIIVRCNLTILFEEGMEYLADFYADNKVHIVASLPCYTKENVDGQRGEGTFDKCIDALKILNHVGYGRNKKLKIDLVYNPGGSFLPGNQKSLEADYKRVLGDEYGISFNNLITITNMPINRFEKNLKKRDSSVSYKTLLAENFNPKAMEKIMCRDLISVGWDGTLYDCDFNQALNMPLRDETGFARSIRSLDPASIVGEEIHCADHCLGCVAGEGSSCSGALT